jgi:hypothetical protein
VRQIVAGLAGLVLVASRAAAAPAAEPQITLEHEHGFPAISKDGRSVLAVSVDRGDYEEPRNATVRLLDARSGKLAREIVIDRKRRDERSRVETMDRVLQVRRTVERGGFKSLRPLGAEAYGSAGRWVGGPYSFFQESQARDNVVRVEMARRLIVSSRLPRVPVAGVCAGDLRAPTKVVEVPPSLQEVWLSMDHAVAVLEYRAWGARDGCEGRTYFSVLKLPR